VKASRTVLVVLGVLLLAAVLAGGRVAYVRSAYGEWRLSPSSSPPRLSFEGRDYRRGSPMTGVPGGEVVVGHVGGGDLYGPGRRPFAPTVLALRTSGGVTSYSLAGGP
jgi:hypothetical protein